MKFRNSLKNKIIIAIIVTVAFFGTLATLSVLQLTKRSITEAEKGYLSSMATQQKQTVDTVLRDSAIFIRNIAIQNDVIAYLGNERPQIQDPALLERFKQYDIEGRYQSIYLIDRTGKTLVSTDPTFIGQNYGFRDYFKTAMSGAPATDAAIGVTTRKFGYFSAYPVKRADGTVIGVAVAKLRPELINEAIRPKTLGAEGDSMLIDEYGVVIHSDDPKKIYKTLGTPSATVANAIVASKRYGDVKIEPLRYNAIQEALPSMTTTAARSFELFDAMDNRTELIGIAKLEEDMPFYVVIEENALVTAAPANRIAYSLTVFELLTTASAGLLLFILVTQFLDPLQKLKEATKRISEGNFKERVKVTTSDELGELAVTFNDMTGRLDDLYAHLEEKVRVRTADFEKFKLAVEGASDHIIITDIDGRILYANAAAERTTGYSREEMVGQRPSLWGNKMPREFYQTMWKTIKDERRTFHGEVVNRRKGGDLYTAETHIAPLIVTETNELYGFVGIERDITIQKEIDKAKTEFVSIASHQLRTPLAVVNWYLEMLLSQEIGPVNERQRKYLDQVYAASKRMVDLVNSLLSVSRIDLGTFFVEPEQLDVRKAADAVIEELAPQITKRNVSIIRQYAPELPDLAADPSLLRMVFQNILSNAVKYTGEGGTVTISIGSNMSDMRIAVADNGIGIPKRQQSKLFEKFFRADNARTKEPDGNGLGLYIVKSIVEHAKGTIRFESEENKGTTFYITLPLVGMAKKEGIRSLEGDGV